MTSPLLRLFAAFWWLVVLGSLAAAYWIIDDYWGFFTLEVLDPVRDLFHPPTFVPMVPTFVPMDEIVEAQHVWRVFHYSLLSCFLPYVALTIARWIITARWRLGPRW